VSIIRHWIQELCQPEVEKFGVTVPGQHDVIGFDIPVDDIDFMGLVETFRDMQGDFHCSDQIQLVVSDQLADGLPFDELHGDECHAVGLVHIIDLSNGGVTQSGGGTRFLKETALTVPICG
jgi:hypothetical protein